MYLRGRRGLAGNGGISEMSETKKASDVFVECLEAEGCEYIFWRAG